MIERFSEPVAFHGEGPVWIDGALRLVDMLAGDVLTLDDDGAVRERLHVGEVAAALRPRRDGGLVVGVERGFALVGADRSFESLPEVWRDPGVRMNDGGTDPDGRFYCGSMAYEMTPGAGALYRLDPGGDVSVVLPSVTCSNGLAWSPDGTTAYYIDSLTYRIDAFDYDGELTNRRPFQPSRTARDAGRAHRRPRGRNLGRLLGRAAVRRYGPDGTLDEVLGLPVTQVTACTFGGPALDELYITTSRLEVPEGEQPEAGSVYRARPGVSGLAAVPFSG